MAITKVFDEGGEIGDGIDGAVIDVETVLRNGSLLKNGCGLGGQNTGGHPNAEGWVLLGKGGGEGFPSRVSAQGQDGLGGRCVELGENEAGRNKPNEKNEDRDSKDYPQFAVGFWAERHCNLADKDNQYAALV